MGYDWATGKNTALPLATTRRVLESTTFSGLSPREIKAVSLHLHPESKKLRLRRLETEQTPQYKQVVAGGSGGGGMGRKARGSSRHRRGASGVWGRDTQPGDTADLAGPERWQAVWASHAGRPVKLPTSHDHQNVVPLELT